jgi:MFS family permease
MATATTYGTLSATEHSSNLRKAIIASTIGTTIEWYDFFLYGTAAGLIFGKLYFPNEDPLTATLAAFGTYFIGFVGRPIGAAIFGHYGDRIGRKATLIATLLLMGIATFLIAFVPTYADIGIWGAVILTILRMIQGIGVGGEWGGSVLLALPGRNSASPAGCSSRTLRYLRSAHGPAISSRSGAGAFRLRYRSCWSGSDYGSGSAFWRPPCSGSWWRTRKSSAPPCWK